jgi:hypothetical protein
MQIDKTTKLLLAGIMILLLINIFQSPVTPVRADDVDVYTSNNAMLNLGEGLVLIQQDQELYLVGVRSTYDHPIQDHTIQMLNSSALER